MSGNKLGFGSSQELEQSDPEMSQEMAAAIQRGRMKGILVAIGVGLGLGGAVYSTKYWNRRLFDAKIRPNWRLFFTIIPMAALSWWSIATEFSIYGKQKEYSGKINKKDLPYLTPEEEAAYKQKLKEKEARNK
eukprot:TRINITY_DN5708_c0_g1_i1.p1 TRINITY_DN5708_c0_g1~~TRINITY_DN5708_c0_g1_i1.p1  ORF type:complete len:133 (+),score=34.75 TRINITY_DN5708_c0_g1_i1:76-474(+)